MPMLSSHRLVASLAPHGLAAFALCLSLGACADGAAEQPPQGGGPPASAPSGAGGGAPTGTGGGADAQAGADPGAGTGDGGQGGNHVAPPDGSEIALMGELLPGTTVQGTLDSTYPLQGWIASAAAGATLRAALEARALVRPLALFVFGPAVNGDFAGAPLLDAGEGISPPFAVPTSGQYLFAVGALDGRSDGGYELSLTCEGEACAPVSLFEAPCPPRFVGDIVACANDLFTDPNGGASPIDAVVACADAEPLADAYDAACAEETPRPVYCGVSYADAYSQLAPTCTSAALTAFFAQTCIFGSRYPDLFESARLLVLSRRTLTVTTPISELEEQQIISSLHTSSHTEVATAAQAFGAVDGGEIQRVELVDRFDGRRFSAIEYGAGDNSYGRIFVAGSLTPAADIRDGDYDTCTAAPGIGGAACGSDAECQDLQCEGRTDAGAGRCVSTSPVPGEGDPCGATQPCGEGLFCAGLSRGAEGLCVAPWKTGAFSDVALAPIPDGTGEVLSRALVVTGLATVDMDVVIDLVVRHPDARQLTITLVNAAGTEMPVFEGETGGTDLTISTPVLGFPGDEHINGPWTLRVADTMPGARGHLEVWRLSLSSRFD